MIRIIDMRPLSSQNISVQVGNRRYSLQIQYSRPDGYFYLTIPDIIDSLKLIHGFNVIRRVGSLRVLYTRDLPITLKGRNKLIFIPDRR